MDNNIEQKHSVPAEITPEKKLEIFKDEMEKIKKIEMSKKQAWEKRGKIGEAYNPHFDDINPNYLGEAEREIYEIYKSDKLSIGLFNKLKESAMKEYSETSVNEGDEKHKSVMNFWAYMSNRMQAREGFRQLKEMKNVKNQ